MFFKTQSGRYTIQLELSRIQQQAATHCLQTEATYRSLVLGNKHSGGDALSETSGRACDSLTKSTIISKWIFHPCLREGGLGQRRLPTSPQCYHLLLLQLSPRECSGGTDGGTKVSGTGTAEEKSINAFISLSLSLRIRLSRFSHRLQ